MYRRPIKPDKKAKITSKTLPPIGKKEKAFLEKRTLNMHLLTTEHINQLEIEMQKMETVEKMFRKIMRKILKTETQKIFFFY